MNAAELLKYAFLAGLAYAFMRQLRKDVNGIGSCMRSDKGKAERRWKHELADRIEEAVTQEMRNRLAARLRHDAYRD